MRRLPVFCFVLVNLCTVVAASGHAQASTAQPLQIDADFQKLDAMIRAVRNRNAQDYAITDPKGIDEARYVQVGGIEQWITIRRLSISVGRRWTGFGDAQAGGIAGRQNGAVPGRVDAAEKQNDFGGTENHRERSRLLRRGDDVVKGVKKPHTDMGILG